LDSRIKTCLARAYVPRVLSGLYPKFDLFSSPEPTILLACGRDQELWPDPIF